MGWLDYTIIAIVAAWFVFSVVFIFRRRGNTCGCGGNTHKRSCGSCGTCGDCSSCVSCREHNNEKKKK